MNVVRKNEFFRFKGGIVDSYFSKLSYVQSKPCIDFDDDFIHYRLLNIILFNFKYVANHELHEIDRVEIFNYEYVFSFYILHDEHKAIDCIINIHPVTSNPDIITNHPMDSFISILSNWVEKELSTYFSISYDFKHFKSLELTCILKPYNKKLKHHLHMEN